MKHLLIVTFACLLLIHGGFAQAQDKEIAVTINIGKEITGPTPVCVPLTLSANQAKWTVVSSGKILGQLTAPGLTTEQIKPDGKGVRRDLHFILTDKAAAGTTLALKFAPQTAEAGMLKTFNFKDKKGEYEDFCYGDRPILRYMYKAYDDSNTKDREKTYKIFHHVFDPTGKQIVTSGGFTDDRKDALAKSILWPHHRGLMLGFASITYDDGKKMDSWHCPRDMHQSHEGFLSTETGPVLGRQRIANVWYADKKTPVVREQRELTVYNLPGGNLIEFASLLKPDHGKVKLDGDPEHAGFQFRAHNDVHAPENEKQTYYLRLTGKGEFGQEQHGKKDLPWDALSFVLKGQRYTVGYLDSPKNPHPEMWSERAYGRFGCFFKKEITPESPIVLNYRIWLQQGEMTGEQVQALADRFVSPPTVAK